MSRVLLLLVSGDIFSALLVQYLGFQYLFRLSSHGEEDLPLVALRAAVFAFVLVLITFLAELYDSQRSSRKRNVPLRICISLVLSFGALSVIHAQIPALAFDQTIMVAVLVMFGCLQWIWHLYCPSLLKASGMMEKVLILGVGPMARSIERIMSETKHNYVLAGYIQPDGELASVPQRRILAPLEGLLEAATREGIDKIVISLSERRGVLPVRELLQARFSGIEIVDAASFHEELTKTLLVRDVNPGWFIYSSGFCLNAYKRLVKRSADVFLSLFGIVIVAPLLPILALAIKLDSPGDILFRQKRLGLNECEFNLYKFRTMRQDAEDKSGAVWAREDDPRVTRLGRFLRKSRIDEIPQLYNVLKGDMALVGPRPERPEFVSRLKEEIPYYSKRHIMKPGVTGWAQVKYPYGASIEDAHNKLKYDLYYIKHFSLCLDALVILKTIRVVLCGRGGR